jgi:regulator of sirC expression with transglutaminase-like and TPR domain
MQLVQNAAVSRMKPTVASATPPPLTQSQKAALLNLLTDDDPAIYQLIRNKILSHGPTVKEWLRGYTLSSDPVLRRRAQEIVDHLERQAADNRFLAFCLSRGEDLDVEQGAWLLAQTQYPNINIIAYQALFDSYAADLRERIDFGQEPERILAVINQYLFTDQRFSGNEENYYDPDNSFLNRVLDRKRGNPISLCAVYIAVARRLRLPVAGIGMPGHFLCRYQSSRGEIFIDAFRQGKFLSKADCVKYLISSGHDGQEGALAPVTPRRMLLRMCHNLHHIYHTLELADETARLQRYIVALSK